VHTTAPGRTGRRKSAPHRKTAVDRRLAADIRRQHRDGTGAPTLAAKYGISTQTIYNISRRIGYYA
jgi:Mor family transcriptional regulator